MDFMSYAQSPLYHQGLVHSATMPTMPYSHPHDVFSYMDPQQRSSMYMQRRTASFDDLRQVMLAAHEKNETKARLAKNQVEILERKFQENNKPNSQTKRILAQEFGVEQARINNWFQNRRAKAKQERKQMEHDLERQEDNTFEEDSDSAPENFSGDFEDSFSRLPVSSTAQMPILSGPLSAPLYAGGFEDANASSIHSLQHFEATPLKSGAEFQPSAAVNGLGLVSLPTGTNGPVMISGASNFFPVEFSPTNTQSFDSQLQETCSNDGLSMRYQSHAMIPTLSAPSHMMSSPESDGEFSLNSIPGPSDIASRRAKQRPANLGVDALRGSMGPRSFSSSDVPQRLNSPTSNSLRRVTSNQMNLNVLSGRIQKSSMQNLRSPMAKNFSATCENYLRELPHQAAFARDFPPTPHSPYDNHMLRSTSSSTSGPDSESNFVLAAMPSYEANASSHMVSPPETPHNPIVNNHWNFDVMDRPLQTPTFEMFGGDLGMTQFMSPMNHGLPVSSPQLEYGFDQHQLEYLVSDEQSYAPTHSVRSSPVSCQKPFTFNHMTLESLKQQ